MEEHAVVTIGSEVEIQPLKPAPLQDDSVLLESSNGGIQPRAEGEVGEVKEEGGGESGGETENKDVGVPDRLQRFYFESDALVLKNNIDYQKMLKTLALLEAQKIQATKDLEQLVVVKTRALRDPARFVTALKNGTLEPLPTRQQVAELPVVNWNGYMESVEKIVRQHSSVCQRTRRRGLVKEPTSLTKMETSASEKTGAARPASYKQPWTAEEQMRLEELLKTYPPEAVERRRYEKIARALGTRTTQQVASHVQKFFIKLARAGLPVPGRMPNMAAYGPKGKKGGRAKRFIRPSTFFSTLAPRVFMLGGDARGGASSPSYSPTPLEGDEEEEEEEEEEEGEEEEEEGEGEGEEGEGDSTDSDDSLLAKWVPTGTSSQAAAPSVRCGRCQVEVRYGQYWECSDCPINIKTLLCSDCINSDHQTPHHSQDHEMLPRALPTGLADQDYAQFSQTTNREYNYLDPNFCPAS